MDLRGMAEKLGFEDRDFRELVRIFLETSRVDLEALRKAIDRRDLAKVVEFAHSLKGAAGALGIHEIQDLAKKIVENARREVLDESVETAAAIERNLERIAAGSQKEDSP